MIEAVCSVTFLSADLTGVDRVGEHVDLLVARNQVGEGFVRLVFGVTLLRSLEYNRNNEFDESFQLSVSSKNSVEGTDI